MKIRLSQLRQLIKEELLRERLQGLEKVRAIEVLKKHAFELYTTNDAHKHNVAHNIIEGIKKVGIHVSEENERLITNQLINSISYFNGASLNAKRTFVTLDEEKFAEKVLFDHINWLWEVPEKSSQGLPSFGGVAPQSSPSAETRPMRALNKPPPTTHLQRSDS